MAKPQGDPLEGQGLTQKQLKRLQRKQKKLLAEAGLPLETAPITNVVALGSLSPPEKSHIGKKKNRKGQMLEAGTGVNVPGENVPGVNVPGENVPTRRSTRGRKSANSGGVLAGKSGDGAKGLESTEIAGGVLADDNDYIRNSLVGKVAEALLRKQLEEEAQGGPVKKKARLANRASDEVPPVEPSVGGEKLPAGTGKKKAKTKLEKVKLKKEKKKQKKERQKQGRLLAGPQEGLGIPSPGSRHKGGLDSGGGDVLDHSSKKRRRAETDPRDKKKRKAERNKGLETESPALTGVSQQPKGIPLESSSRKRLRVKEDKQTKQKQVGNEQTSPWPEIRYEAASAQVLLRPGQSVMVDGAANVTLLSGGASVMGYRLQKDGEVLISSSGQLAPVPIIVYDCGRPSGMDAGLTRKVGLPVSEGPLGEEDESAETMLLIRSHWPKQRDAVRNQRTFRLEPKAPVGSAKAIPKPPLEPSTPSPSKTKAPEPKLHPIVIPLAWKTVTDSLFHSVAAKTCEGTVPEQTGVGSDREAGLKAGLAEVGIAGVGLAGVGLAGPPIVAICGGKNVGKSTYGQYLVNRLLNSYLAVAYLETDVGQPEFTAPGLLSLHLLTAPVCGPPSTHLREPTASFFYGDVSAKTDPELYLRCVVALYDEFRRNYYDGATDGTRIPLVINTHGWVKGLGLDVLIDILRYTVPTHVVDVQSAKANKNLPPGNFWETAAEPLSRVHYVSTAVPDTPDASTPFAHKFAPEERALRLLAHFQAATDSGDPPGLGFSENVAYSSLATCLVHHRPFQVRLDSVRILQLHGSIPPEEALWALNGAVVGLAKATGEAETGPLPKCKGVGLVRGIDAAKGVLYLVTCLPLSELQNVNTLIQGKVDLPLQLLSAPPYVSPYLALNSIAAEGTGSAMVKSRNNIVRKVGD